MPQQQQADPYRPEPRDPMNPRTVCALCRHVRFQDGDNPWCYATARRERSPVTGRLHLLSDSIVECRKVNTDGECPKYEAKTDAPEPKRDPLDVVMMICICVSVCVAIYAVLTEGLP